MRLMRCENSIATSLLCRVQVGSEGPGVAQVDVRGLVFFAGVVVDQHPDYRGHGAGNGDLLGAEQGHAVKAHGASGNSGKLSAEVGCAGEDAADEHLWREPVALGDLAHQLGCRVEYLLALVLLDVDGSSEGK